MSRPIPVVVVAGFLGSGKTTLLNHLLRLSGGTRIGVVVNDFGAINIDSMLVAGQVDAMVSLGNGCVCCAVDGSDMDAMFARLAHPRSELDVIVVEASGLAEPRNLVRLVLGSPNQHIRYGGLVEVVDAAEFDSTVVRHPEIVHHLRLADLVVANKVDRVADPGELVERLRSVVGAVPVVATTGGRIAADLLFDPPERAPDAQLTLDQLLLEDVEHDHRHLHEDYTSVSFDTEFPLHPRALLTVFEEPPAGLFRAKGIVRFLVEGRARVFEVQVVGRHIRMARRRGATANSQLVLIGSGLDVAAARTRLDAAVYTGPPLGADDLLPVWRYAADAERPSNTV